MEATDPIYHINDKVYAPDKFGVWYAGVIRRFALQNDAISPETLNTATTTTIVTTGRSHWTYFVHYQGWSSRHDRWVHESEILPDNEESRAHADASLKLAWAKEHKRKTSLKSPTPRAVKSSPGASRKRKQSTPSSSSSSSSNSSADAERCNNRTGSNIASPDSRHNSHTSISLYNKSLEEYCSLPFTLCTILMDERVRITRLGRYTCQGYDDPRLELVHGTPCTTTLVARQVHVLPTKPSVECILQRFVESKRKEYDRVLHSNSVRRSGRSITTTSGTHSVLEKDEMMEYEQLAKSLIQLFNQILPKCLLYTPERSQYLSLLKQENNPQIRRHRPMSQIYGGEFLLRLLVRLPYFFVPASDYYHPEMRVVYPSDYFITRQRNSIHPSSHTLDRTTLSIGTKLAELIVFLQTNTLSFFRSEYRDPLRSEQTDIELGLVQRCTTSHTKLLI